MLSIAKVEHLASKIWQRVDLKKREEVEIKINPNVIYSQTKIDDKQAAKVIADALIAIDNSVAIGYNSPDILALRGRYAG